MEQWRRGIAGSSKDADGAVPVTFGPMDDALPSRFTATTRYTDLPIELVMEMTFDGSRIRVAAATTRRIDDLSLTPRDMTLLELGAAVHDAASRRVNPGHGVYVGRQQADKPTAEVLRLVAQVYWCEYVTWGEPRRAVMAYWNLPSHTAVRWIRKARELYKLPDLDRPASG